MRSFVIFTIFVTGLFVYVLSQSQEFVLMKGNKYADEKENVDHYHFKNYVDLKGSRKPKIFVHIPEKSNALCNICVKSLIRVFDDSHDIVLYDNETAKLLINEPDEKDLCNIQNPNLLQGVDLKQWENYIKAKILYTFGGTIMEPYFMFTEKPIPSILKPNDLMILHHANEGMNVSSKPLIPWINYYMCAPKQNKNVSIYMKYLEYLCINQYTEDHKHFDKTFEKLYALDYIHPKYMGIKDAQDNIVLNEQLFQKQPIEFDDHAFCLFVNIPLIQKQRKYGYILNMNEEQLTSMNVVLSDFMNRYFEL